MRNSTRCKICDSGDLEHAAIFAARVRRGHSDSASGGGRGAAGVGTSTTRKRAELILAVKSAGSAILSVLRWSAGDHRRVIRCAGGPRRQPTVDNVRHRQGRCRRRRIVDIGARPRCTGRSGIGLRRKHWERHAGQPGASAVPSLQPRLPPRQSSRVRLTQARRRTSRETSCDTLCDSRNRAYS